MGHKRIRHMRTDVAASDPPSDSARSPRRRPIRGARGVTPPVAVYDPNSFEDGALGPLESDAERGMERGEQEPRNALMCICEPLAKLLGLRLSSVLRFSG